MNEPKWKKFEKVVYQIQKDMAKDAEVKINDKIIGVDSKIPRQIDISIRKHIGQYQLLIIIQCKDQKAPIDVNRVGEFVSVVRDVRANKGAMISSSGFTKAAIDLSKTHGINTYRLIDTKSIDWKVYAYVPVLMERYFMKNYNLKFKDFRILPLMDFRVLRIFDESENYLGTIQNIIAKKWNDKEIKQEPGELEVLIGENLFAEIEEQRIRTTIIAQVTVGREYYFGSVPIDMIGFRNEKTDSVITKEIITKKIEPFKIEKGLVKGWKKIEDPKKLAVRPFIGITYSDEIHILQN